MPRPNKDRDEFDDDEEEEEEEEVEEVEDEDEEQEEEQDQDDDMEEVDIDEMGVRNESEEEEEEREDVWKNGPHPVDQEVDPEKCYIHSFSKEGVGRFIKKTKLKITWELVIEGEEHTIAVYEEEEFFDAGLDFTFPFRIEGREVSVIISDALGDGKVGWNYDILIDGVSLNELNEERSMGAGGTYEEDAELFD